MTLVGSLGVVTLTFFEEKFYFELFLFWGGGEGGGCPSLVFILYVLW